MSTDKLLPYEVREQMRYLKGLRWETELPPAKKINLWPRIKSIGVSCAVCFGLIGIIGIMQNHDLSVKLEIQRGIAARFQNAKDECANDKFYRASHICQKILAPLPKVDYSRAL